MKYLVVLAIFALSGCATTRAITFSPCTDAETHVPLKVGQATAWDVTTSEIPFLTEPHRVIGFVDAKGVCQPTVEGPVSNSLESILSQPLGTMMNSPLIGAALVPK